MANVMDSSVPSSEMGVPFQPPFIHTQTYYSELKTTKVSDHVCFSLEESSLLLCNVGMKKAILYTLSSLKHRFPPSFNFAVWKMAPSEKESHAEFASSFFSRQMLVVAFSRLTQSSFPKLIGALFCAPQNAYLTQK